MYLSKILFLIMIVLCWSCQEQTTPSQKHREGDGHNHSSDDGHNHSKNEGEHHEDEDEQDHPTTATNDHNHNENEGEHHEGDGHNHEAKTLSLEEIEQKQCEHNIRQLDCNDCRSELGVVKVDADTQSRMLKIAPVTATHAIFPLLVNGEVQLNPLKTVVVMPMVAGRIASLHCKAGQTVKLGDLLAVLESQEYAKLKLDYISAVRQAEIADKNLEWVNLAHQNLQRLLETLQKGSQNGDLSKLLTNLKMGKYKQELIEVASVYRSTKLKYEREKQILQNLEKLLALLQSNKTNLEVEIKPLIIGEWKTKVWGAYSRWVLAEKNYQREKTLATNHASTQKELQEAENAYISAKADYDGVREEAMIWGNQRQMDIQAEFELAIAKYQTVLEEVAQDLQVHQLETQREATQATLEKATCQRQLRLLGLNQADLDYLLSANGKDNFGTLSIRSPIAGTIVDVHGSEGQFVDAQKELYNISDLETLWVHCDIYDTDVAKLAGAQASTKAEVFTNSEKIPGELEYVSDVVDEKTRTLKVRVVVPNSKKLLRPGMFVKVQLQLTRQEKAFFIPEPALFEDMNEKFVFKKWKDLFWLRTDVETGIHYGDQIEIIHGLAEGDQIVTHGGFMLKSEVLKNKMGAG